MPNFAATMINPSTGDVGLSISNGVLAISDWSNYFTSTETGHLTVNFSAFKKIVVTNPDDTQYILSTLGDGDVLINPPSSYAVSPLSETYTVIDEGLYKVNLYVVPTYSVAVTYGVGDSVYYSNDIYISKLASNTGNNPAISFTYWQVADFDQIPDKYSYEGLIVFLDSVEEAWADLVLEANESIDARCKGDELCKNELIRKAMRMDNTLNGIQLNVNLGNVEMIEQLYDEAVELKNCLP